MKRPGLLRWFHADDPRRRRARPGADVPEAQALVDRIAAVDWSALQDAYGPAGETEHDLVAVVVGDNLTRSAAWERLWTTIHHQGDVYSATGPAVPVLVGLATWRAYPDRAEALRILREVGRADDGEPLRADIESGLDPLLADWRSEPPVVQRALLWVLSALPAARERHADLVTGLVPAEHAAGWAVAVRGLAEDSTDAEGDALDALEHWLWHGTSAP